MREVLPSGTAVEVALPPGGAPPRGVVICPDIMGLRPLFDDLVAGLAAGDGWAAAAVEPFPGAEDRPLPERLAGRLDTPRLLDDLQAAADRLGTDRTAVLGFCMGGLQAFRAAATGRFDRAVAFYGMIRPPEQWSTPGGDPLDALARPESCPTLAVIGGVDHWTPPEDVEALAALADVTVAAYPDADHGFVHDPTRPAHRPGDAADAWARVAAFLRT